MRVVSVSLLWAAAVALALCFSFAVVDGLLQASRFGWLDVVLAASAALIFPFHFLLSRRIAVRLSERLNAEVATDKERPPILTKRVFWAWCEARGIALETVMTMVRDRAQ